METTRINLNVRRDWVSRLGFDSLTYSTLQNGLSYFDTHLGFIAYKNVLGRPVVLGVPVALTKNYGRLFKKFFDHNRQALFTYLDESSALELNRQIPDHFRFIPMGNERLIHLKNFDHSESEIIQGALKKAEKHKFSISEVRSFDPQMIKRFEEISEKYLKHKSISREMTFYNRPAHFTVDHLARFFSLQQDGNIFGFAILDPYNVNGQRGYLLNVVRFENTKQWGVYMACVHHLALLLQSEGVSELSLGHCPLDEFYMHSELPTSAKIVRDSQWVIQNKNVFYNLDHIEQYKKILCNQTKRRYSATRHKRLLIPSLVMVSAMKISWFRMSVNYFFRKLEENFI